MSRGGLVRRRYNSLFSGAYIVPAAALHDLSNDPDVAYIVPDRPVHPRLDYTAAAVNAAIAWSSNLTGSGIGIALIDSGVNPSTDLRSRIVYSQDFTSSPASQASLSAAGAVTISSTSTSTSSSSSSTVIAVGGTSSSVLSVSSSTIGPDLFGHGEHVAGILAGNGTLSSCAACTRSIKGIAPGANIINLRVLDSNGAGTDSDVIAAIDARHQLSVHLQHPRDQPLARPSRL